MQDLIKASQEISISSFSIEPPRGHSSIAIRRVYGLDMSTCKFRVGSGVSRLGLTNTASFKQW